jgi:hypothetical protein
MPSNISKELTFHLLLDYLKLGEKQISLYIEYFRTDFPLITVIIHVNIFLWL